MTTSAHRKNQESQAEHRPSLPDWLGVIFITRARSVNKCITSAQSSSHKKELCMQRTLLAGVITALSCTAAWAATPRIVGGDDFTNAPSWMAALQYRVTNGSYSQFCGATLIDDDWVLTAAHCVDWVELDRLNLLLGQANLNSSAEGIKVDQLILYPGWIPSWEISSAGGSRAISQFAGDLALLHIKQAQSATPITLATPNQLSSLNQNQNISAIGWGATDRSGTVYPNQLQGLALPYQGKDATFGLANHIFAGGEDGENICFGDSGGPLYLTGTPDVQYGIDSFVTSFGSAITCGDSAGVSGFTSVADYRDWIQQQLTGLSYTTTQNLAIITGTAAQANFVIRNNSAQEWTISSLTSDGGTLTDDCQSAALQPGSSCNVTLAYTAGQTGSSRIINLSFNASSPDDAIAGQMQLIATAVADPNSSDDDDGGSGGGAFGQLSLLLLTLLAAGQRLSRRQRG